MSGGFCGSLASRRSGPWGRPLKETRMRSGGGGNIGGRLEKKRRKRRANHCLRRRERPLGKALPDPNLGAEGPDAGPPIPLQLEPALGDRRDNALELLLPSLPGIDRESRSGDLPLPSASPHPSQAAGDLGLSQYPPRSVDLGVRGQQRSPHEDRVPPGLRPRAQPGRVHLGSLEEARTAQSLSQRLRPTRLPRALSPASDAPTPDSRHRILETVRPLRVVTILCDTQ